MFRNLLRSQVCRTVSARLTVPLQRQTPRFFLPISARSTQTMHADIEKVAEMQRPNLEELVEKQNESANADVDPFRREGTVPSRSVFVGGLPFSVEETEIREMFAPYGTITNVRIATADNGRRIGYAHVEFSAREEALAVFESGAEEPFVLFDRQLRIEMSSKAKAKRVRGDPGEPGTTLHIANHPRPGDERAIRELLADFDKKIVRISFMRDIEGRFTPKTFVQFSDVESATQALAGLMDAELDGAELKVFYAREKRRRPTGMSRNGDRY